MKQLIIRAGYIHRKITDRIRDAWEEGASAAGAEDSYGALPPWKQRPGRPSGRPGRS